MHVVGHSKSVVWIDNKTPANNRQILCTHRITQIDQLETISTNKNTPILHINYVNIAYVYVRENEIHGAFANMWFPITFTEYVWSRTTIVFLGM